MDRVSDPQGGTEAFTWMSTAVADGTALASPRRGRHGSLRALLPLLAVAIALSGPLRRARRLTAAGGRLPRQREWSAGDLAWPGAR
jgi:hypothetical protein